jgi:hypothetical protein
VLANVRYVVGGDVQQQTGGEAVAATEELEGRLHRSSLGQRPGWSMEPWSSPLALRALRMPRVSRVRPSSSALTAGFARIRVRAFGLRRGFRHVCASLGCAVVLRALAVIDLGGRIQPDQTWSTARSWRR